MTTKILEKTKLFPYHDDFDANNNFHRILFVPERPVQARELTQSQSILQNQITKFGDHVFKKNTPVSGGKITTNFNVKYVKLETTNQNGLEVTASDFLGKVITEDLSSGKVTAVVMATHESEFDENGNIIDPPTLVISYLSGTEFKVSDSVITKDETVIARVISESSEWNTVENPYTGFSSIASIDDGVFYVNGFFVSCPNQTIMIGEYTNTPNVRIGLQVTETIITSEDDNSLLDPALGSSNFQAPGADRYKIELTLITKPLNDVSDDSDFIDLVSVNQGIVERKVYRTLYSEIDDYFAQRTYETNGDFVVDKFKISFDKIDGSSDTFNIKVGPGKAYVRGYLVENQSTLNITSNKARDSQLVQKKGTYLDYGNFLYTSGTHGFFDFPKLEQIEIHLVKNNFTIRSTKTKVADAKVRSIEYVSGTTNPVYKTYLTDIKNNSIVDIPCFKSSSDARNILKFSSSDKIQLTDKLYNNVKGKINLGGLYDVEFKIKSFDVSGGVATATLFSDLPEFSGNVTCAFYFDYSNYNGLFSKDNSRYCFVDDIGRVGGVESESTILFDNKKDEVIYNIGDSFIKENSITNAEYYSWQIYRDQPFSNSTLFLRTPSSNYSIEFVGMDSYEHFLIYNNDTNEIVPPSTYSVVQETDEIRINFSNLSSARVTVYAKIWIKDATDLTHVLKRKILHSANTAQIINKNISINVDGVFINKDIGQVLIPNGILNSEDQKLYISDVKNIVKIIDTVEVDAELTLEMLKNPSNDVTRYFSLDNGQRDSYYDHASIKLNKGFTKPTGDVIVLFNYYSHESGDGYFNVDSYIHSLSPETYDKIPSYTSSTGTQYNLRDCIDFRPTVKNLQTTFELELNSHETYSLNAVGAYIPIDNSNFECSYEHYLGRKDVIIVTKDNNINLIEGISSTSPREPKEPDGSIVIAKLSHDPYTMYVSNDGTPYSTSSIDLEIVDHKRWRMEDISKIEDRVSRLEYYTSLNNLEQSTKNLQILDQNNINRFKSGILTDDFSSLKISDTSKIDYSASINSITQELMPAHDVKNFKLFEQSSLYTSNELSAKDEKSLSYNVDFNGTTSYTTLKYSKTPAIAQKFASRTININPFNFIDVEGLCSINPSMDNWVSVTKNPDLLISNIDNQLYLQTNVLNSLTTGSWQTISSAQTEESVTQKIIPKNKFGRNMNIVSLTSNDILNYLSVFGSSLMADGETLESKNYKNYSTSAQLDNDLEYLSYLQNQVGSFVSYEENLGTGINDTNISSLSADPSIEKQRELTNGYWKNLGNKYEATNGFITDISINPYIRPQEIEFVSSDLLYDAPVSCFFDGENVNNRIRLPNSLKIENIKNQPKFKQSEIIGYKTGISSYVPIGKILYTKDSGKNELTGLTYQNIDIIWDIYADRYFDSTFSNDSVLYTLKFDINGEVSSATSSATLISYEHKSGYIRDIDVANKTLKLSQLASPSDSEYVGKYLNIIFSGYQLELEIVGYDGNTKVATCNTSTFNTSLLNQVYTIKESNKQLLTDNTGAVSGIFYLPENRFNVGEKVFRIDNRTGSDERSYTCFSQAKFFASSIKTQKQNSNFSPDISSSNFLFTRTENKTSREIQTIKSDSLNSSYINNFKDPVCQTFILYADNYPNGAFLKSIKLFFKTKPSYNNSPITISIIGTNNGYPNGETLSHSVVTLTPDKVNVSDTPHILDLTTYTEFEFPVPIYVKPETLYALLIKTNSKDYTIYSCKIGEESYGATAKNLPTDENPIIPLKISQIPYVGDLFLSQNALTWDADKNQSLMFEIDRCEFSTSAATVNYLLPKYLPNRKVVDQFLVYKSNNVESLAQTSPILSSSDFVADAFNFTTTDLVFENAPIAYSYRATLNSNKLPESSFHEIVPGRFGTAKINDILLNDGFGSRLLKKDSDNSLLLTATLKSNDSKISPIISDAGLTLYAIKYRINNLGLSNNNFIILNGGSGYSSGTYTLDSANTIEGAGSGCVVNVTAINGAITNVVVTNPGFGYANTKGTVISLTGGNGAVIDINSETNNSGGNALYRHITKPVILDTTFAAGDLAVYYSAFRPLGTEIYIYYKILNYSDSQSFDDSDWQLMTCVSGNKQYSSTKDDYYEYVAAPGSVNKNSYSVDYSSKTTGTAYTTFTKFAIKIVCSTADSTVVPKIKDFRAIALYPSV